MLGSSKFLITAESRRKRVQGITAWRADELSRKGGDDNQSGGETRVEDLRAIKS